MLMHLLIENLMLIQQAQITMDDSFIAITGESGSGKSSLMEALKLALGAKSSSDMIRRGQEMGRVRVSLDLSNLEPVTRKRIQKIFEESCLPWDESEPLIIQRQIYSSKPSKAFVGEAPVPLSFLSRLGVELVEVVDAGASLCLESLDSHLECLDAFAGVEDLRQKSEELWNSYQSCQNELERLKALLETREQQKILLEYQIEEIENASLRDGEEQELSESLRLLTTREQLIETLNLLQMELTSPTFQKLTRYLSQFERCARGYPAAENLSLCLQGTLVQASEAQEAVERLRDSIDMDTNNQQTLTKRLDQIHLLKKKYGSTIEEIYARLEKSKAQLQEILGAEERLSELEKETVSYLQEHQQICEKLSEIRLQSAQDLSTKIIEVIRDLNMPHADFSIQITARAPGPTGKDCVEFFLRPNPGEPALSVRRFASGGEMARLFLALKTLKAHRRIPPTLIFDEIDASIGGNSAARLGEKLQALSQTRQVVCITHFPQVAERASCHLVMEKQVLEGRTLATVRKLQNKRERQDEIQRMLGKSISPL